MLIGSKILPLHQFLPKSELKPKPIALWLTQTRFPVLHAAHMLFLPVLIGSRIVLVITLVLILRHASGNRYMLFTV